MSSGQEINSEKSVDLISNPPSRPSNRLETCLRPQATTIDHRHHSLTAFVHSPQIPKECRPNLRSLSALPVKFVAPFFSHYGRRKKWFQKSTPIDEVELQSASHRCRRRPVWPTILLSIDFQLPIVIKFFAQRISMAYWNDNFKNHQSMLQPSNQFQPSPSSQQPTIMQQGLNRFVNLKERSRAYVFL